MSPKSPPVRLAPAKSKSRARQLVEIGQLASRLVLLPSEYRLYRFDEIGKDYAYMLDFMPIHAMRNRFRGALNDTRWKALLDNKWLFHLHYRHFGLRLPKLYGMFEPGAGLRADGLSLVSADDLLALLQEMRPSSLVVKPLGGIMGKEVVILDELRYDAGDCMPTATTNTGETLTFAELVDRLERRPDVRYYQSGGYELSYTGYLLEEKIAQHGALADIAPFTTNTVRVVTLLDHTGSADVQFAILRLGREGNAADNWDRGGISVRIDLDSGTLGAGLLKPVYGGNWVDAHPDTSVRFTGVELPFWDDILELATNAARVTPRVRSVGWDVIVSPDGPVLIEGNPDWDLTMVQVHTDGYLKPRVREQLAHFGLTFPEGRLPSIAAREWCVRYREHFRARRFYRRSLS
jgi:Sugar-transfer associated ATP-grasp